MWYPVGNNVGQELILSTGMRFACEMQLILLLMFFPLNIYYICLFFIYLAYHSSVHKWYHHHHHHVNLYLCMFLFYFFLAVGDLNVTINETVHQGEFKSHQWFGATVRVHKDSVLVRSYSYFYVENSQYNSQFDSYPPSNQETQLFLLEHLLLNEHTLPSIAKVLKQWFPNWGIRGDSGGTRTKWWVLPFI